MISATIGEALASSAAQAAAACTCSRHACGTDWLTATGARFPPVGREDLDCFNALTLPRGGGDFFAEERAERRRYEAVALFFSYDRACGTPFREWLEGRLAPARGRGAGA